MAKRKIKPSEEIKESALANFSSSEEKEPSENQKRDVVFELPSYVLEALLKWLDKGVKK